jgi:hypothetical protein
MLRRLVVAAAAILALAGPQAAAQTARLTRDNNLMFVDCGIDGLTQRCEIDTGATELWLPRRPEFRAYPVARTGGVMGVSGRMLPASYVEVGELRFGGFTLRGVEALMADGSADHGVIGLDALRRLGVFTLDYRRDELRREPPAEADLCPLPFSVESGMIQVPVRLAARLSLKAGWDSGANTTVADAAFIRAHPELFDFVRTLRGGVDATTSGVPVSLYRTRSISVCGQSLRNVAVVAVDMSGPRAAIPGFADLTLGTNVLDGLAWSFDFETGRWAVR